MKNTLLAFGAVALVSQVPASLCSNASAATWQYVLPVVKGAPAPTIEVCSLKYGKTWAYSFEQDDGPVGVLNVTQPFFAKYGWNDAPPGVAGGTNRPFVGTAAIILGSVGSNDTVLSFEQIAELKKRGWGIANHSFWHTGVHWDPKLLNTPEQNRRELFWSQTFFAEFVGHGRAATHFVFPNGDYNYGPYLKEYGLLCGTRTSGWSPHNLLDPKLNLLNFPRAYLDENNWANSNDPMQEFPAKPQANDFLIDFTHGMDGDPQSANNKRWVARLDHITQTWGPKGDNSMWVAPSDEVVAYFLAARVAKASVNAGKITVALPEEAPGSALTLKISGLSEKAVLKLPAGGTIVRQGATAWLTTPVIGQLGAAPPAPHVHCIYQGEVKDLAWDKPVAIAGVRVNRSGKLPDGFELKVEALTPDGKTENIVTVDRAALDKKWGNQLYCVLPDHPAIAAKELHVTKDQGLSTMEVWGVSP